MFIGLRIDNADRLPGGGPLSYRSDNQGFEIGRENRDWTLPDPDKFISGRHCEVRYENGAFWLHDVSRNGTFVNGSSQRVVSPYRLSHGDRRRIGRYIISVSIEDQRHGLAAMDKMDSRSSLLRPGDRQASGFANTFADDWERRRAPAGLDQDGESAASPKSGRSDPPLAFERDPFLTPPRPVAQTVGQHQRPPLTAQVEQSRPSTSGQPVQASDMLRNIAIGAGIAPEVLLLRDPNEVAVEIGGLLRIVVDELALLLKARAAAKLLAKSGHRTMISPTDNNPLKFVPASEEILEIMFARRRAGYLDAKHSIEEAFRDLKTHEFATYAAMQSALLRLLDDLSPDAIEQKLPPSSFASKKGRAWDTFVSTWQVKEEAHENGMLDVFLAYFSEAYAKAAKPK